MKYHCFSLAIWLLGNSFANAQPAQTYPALSLTNARVCAISLANGGLAENDIAPPMPGMSGSTDSNVIHNEVMARDAFLDKFNKTPPVVSLAFDPEKTDDARLRSSGPEEVWVYSGIWLNNDTKHNVVCTFSVAFARMPMLLKSSADLGPLLKPIERGSIPGSTPRQR